MSIEASLEVMSTNSATGHYHLLVVDGAVFGDVMGGSHRFSLEGATTLAERGWAVTLAAPDVRNRQIPAAMLGPLRIIRYRYPRGVWARALGNWALLLETIRVLRDIRRRLEVDVAWVHTPVAAAALRLSGWTVPVMWTVHGPAIAEAMVRGGLSCLRRKAIYAVERIGASHATILTFASEYMKRVCVDEFGLCDCDSKALVLPLGVHVTGIASQVNLSQRPPIGEGVRVVSVRRLDPRMGLDSLVHAIRLLKTRGLSVTLDIVGEGPDRDRLARLISQYRLSSVVRLRGRLEDTEVIRLYNRSHIAVLPSRELEGFGLSMIEAMSAGIPVVVTPVGAMPTVIGREFPNLVADGSGPEQLAETIAMISAMGEDEYRGLCKRVQSFSRQFDWKVIVELYERLLVRLASGQEPLASPGGDERRPEGGNDSG